MTPRLFLISLIAASSLVFCSDEVVETTQQTPIENPYVSRNDRWLTQVWERKGTTPQPHAANGYDVVTAHAWEAIVANMLKKTGISHGANVFDFGCGVGSSSIILCNLYNDITLFGVDYSAPLIKRAQALLPHGTFWTQNIAEPLKQKPEQKFDLALCNGVFIYLNSEAEVEQSILNMASILKAGAKMLLSDISDIKQKELADKVRNAVHTKIEKVSSDTSLDHLYLSREFFTKMATKLNAKIEFIEFNDLDPAGNYPNGAYRFNVMFTLPELEQTPAEPSQPQLPE